MRGRFRAFQQAEHLLERFILPKHDLRPKKKTKQTRRPRRSTEEIVDNIMEAACDEFERNGYPGTKTAAIARKAGVAEALIFSNFGSKARLFQGLNRRARLPRTTRRA